MPQPDDFSDYLLSGRSHGVEPGQVLRAGPVALLFDGEGLRYIRVGSIEIVRRIHAAVRDCNWGTPPIKTSEVHIETSLSSFRVQFVAHCQESEIHYRWKVTIVGSDEGSIVFRFEGEALSDFLTNRIGLYVLHPVRECVGKSCEVTGSAGERREMIFPDHVSPGSPFGEFVGLRYETAPGLYAGLQFEGEVFEMEDQRNWTDASFKTFSTPLRQPHPWAVKKGERVTQCVRLKVEGEIKALPEQKEKTETRTVLTVSGQAGRLPQLGLSLAMDGIPLREAEIERLRQLRLDHLRVDLDLDLPNQGSLLQQADLVACSIGSKLEIAVRNAMSERFPHLASCAAALKSTVARWLIFPSTVQIVDAARKHLSVSGASIVGGTDDNFAELNESPPRESALDAVCFSINPQVHSSDDLSLMENLEAQSDTVLAARDLFGNLPVVVSPVTLKPRRNPVAILSRPAASPLPETVDARQSSMLAAGWTLGSLKCLSEAAVSSITYFETAGWRGVMEREGGSPRPEHFHSSPGSIFPVYIVFALMAGASGGVLHLVKSSDPLRVVAFGFEIDGLERFLVANLSGSTLPVAAGRFARKMETRIFDAIMVRALQRGARLDMVQPASWGDEDGWNRFELPPYAVGTLEATDNYLHKPPKIA